MKQSTSDGQCFVTKAQSPHMALDDATIAARTDAYFNKAQTIIAKNGDCRVTYALFIRRPVISAPRFMMEWLNSVSDRRGFEIDYDLAFPEGEWVGAGEPLMYLSGPFSGLVNLETLLLQKLGPACVAAYNAYQMAQALPKVKFMAMEARHCAGFEMQEMMSYAASVGSRKAQKEGAIGFIGNSNDATAGFYGQEKGLGTMPHALIGYAGSTLRAAEMYHEAYPEEDLVILPDYYGQEITDSLEVCRRFPDLAAAGRIAVRLDTHGGRFLEGLDIQSSYAVLERNSADAIRRYRSEKELKDLVGTGVSAAAVWRMREALDEAGFERVRIIASSGFNAEKCRSVADAHVPVDVIGTGSFIPEVWTETYATADIIAYDDRLAVKKGREFLFKMIKNHQSKRQEKK